MSEEHDDLDDFEKRLAEELAVLDTKTPEELIAIGLDQSASFFQRTAALSRPKTPKDAAIQAWEQIICNRSEDWGTRFHGIAMEKLPLDKALQIAKNIVLDTTEHLHLRSRLFFGYYHWPVNARKELAQKILDNPEDHPVLREEITKYF